MSDEKPELHWDAAHRLMWLPCEGWRQRHLRYGAHVCWMLKEIGWALWLPQIGIVFGGLAALFMISSVLVHISRRGFATERQAVGPTVELRLTLCGSW